MIDSHCHLCHPKFEGEGDRAWARARQAGIQAALVVGCDLEDSRQVLAFVQGKDGLFASVGIHPHEASQYSESQKADFQSLSDSPKVLAYGEIGLDFHYDFSPRDVQIQAFEAQMHWAEAFQLPVVIHTREAEAATQDVLQRISNSRGGHVHCFTGTLDLARAILDLGYFVGFTGVVTFKNAKDLHDVVRYVPLNRLLIETDSPYLAPIPHRGKRNEPAMVTHVAECIAQLKGVPLGEVARVTTENFFNLYQPPPEP